MFSEDLWNIFECFWMFLVISTAFSPGIWPLPRGLSESALGFSGATLAVELSSWRVETSLSNNRLTHNIQHIMNMYIRYYFSYRINIYVYVCLYYILVLLVSSLYPYHVEIEGLSPLHSRSSRSKIGPEGARCMCAYQWHQNDISWAHLMMFSGWKILQTEKSCNEVLSGGNQPSRMSLPSVITIWPNMMKTHILYVSSHHIIKCFPVINMIYYST